MASRSGYTALLYIGTYEGAEIDDISVEIEHQPVDVTDLADTWRQRAAGLLDWTVNGSKKYADNEFLNLIASGTTSMVVKVWSQTPSTVIFSAAGFLTRGLMNLPMGAAGEQVTIVGANSTVATASSA